MGYEYVGSLIYRRNGDELELESTDFGGGRIVASQGSSGAVYTPNYFLTDHLGSTRAIVSHSGEVLDRSDYYSFGLKWEHPGAHASDNRWLFNGKERQAVGLSDDAKILNYGARFYNPQIGLWLSIDPLTEIDRSVNSYAYVGNNPIKYIDPNGKEKIIAFDTKDPRNKTLIPYANKYRDDLSIHIFAHGNSGEFNVFMDHGSAVNGIRVDTPEQLEAFLNEYSQTWQNRSADQHVTVVLHSCETGQERNGKSSIARKISNKLKNVTVIAPDEKLAVNRGYELGPFKTPDKPTLTVKDLKTPGNWRYYENGMNINRLYNTSSPPKNFGQESSEPLFFPSFYIFPSYPTVTIEIPYIDYEFLP